MIAKSFPAAASFKRICSYVSKDRSRAEVLELEGVRGHDYHLMADDFETIHALCPGRSRPVFHGVLLFHDQEQLSDAKMVEIARKYLAGIGYENTQYAIVKHTDTAHLHLHLVANRINYDGRYIENFPEMVKSRQALEILIPEYGLVPAGKKDLRLTNWDGLDNPEIKRYIIYNHITDCLRGCENLQTLEQRLLQRGVETKYHLDPASGHPNGISFRYRDEAFRGRSIDPAFSLPKIQQQLQLQQNLSQWESQKREIGWQISRERQLEEQKMKEIEKEQTLEKKHERSYGIGR